MPDEPKILVDVGMEDMPFPMKVASRPNPDGQHTVANISISARIVNEFEAQWINRFIQILHRHRDSIGTKTLRVNILDYLKELRATSVKISFEYPYFIEKRTPVTNDKCLVRYECNYSVKVSPTDSYPKVTFEMQIPAITTDPASVPKEDGGLFGQLSILRMAVQPHSDIYPEDLVDIVDRHALSPVYSYMSPEDKLKIIQTVHSSKRSSVVLVDAIKEELAMNSNIEWYSVQCSNHSLLHSYSTLISTEKSMWIPCSCYEFEEL